MENAIPYVLRILFLDEYDYRFFFWSETSSFGENCCHFRWSFTDSTSGSLGSCRVVYCDAEDVVYGREKDPQAALDIRIRIGGCISGFRLLLYFSNSVCLVTIFSTASVPKINTPNRHLGRHTAAQARHTAHLFCRYRQFLHGDARWPDPHRQQSRRTWKPGW